MADDPRDALIRTLAVTAGPYGFTLSIWGSAAIVVDRHHPPGAAQVAAFAAGAVAAFTLLAGATRGAGACSAEPADDLRARAHAGALNWLAVGAALTAAWVTARLPAAAAWPVTAFAVTAAYLLAAAVQATIVRRRPAVPRWPRRQRPAGRRRR